MLIIIFCLYKINKKLIIKSINNLFLIIKTKVFPHKNKLNNKMIYIKMKQKYSNRLKPTKNNFLKIYIKSRKNNIKI